MQTKKPIINSELLQLVNGKVDDSRFETLKLSFVSSLLEGNPNSISFFNGGFVYLKHLEQTQIGVCLVNEKNKEKIPQQTIAIIVKDPYLAMAQVIFEYIGNGENYPTKYRNFSIENPNISPSAVIAESAKIGENVRILPFVYIGENVEIGDNCTIHSHVSLENCVIGEGSTIRSGAKIGTCGFGFVPNYTNGQHFPIPQISKVIIGKGVDIGANSTIDRGFLNNTKIGNFTKIDNMVHIGHGSAIGNSSFIAGGAMIAGSVEIGNFCMIGGLSAIAGGVILADKTSVMGHSGVASSVKNPGKTIWGMPAVEANLWKKMHIVAVKNATK